MTVNSLSVVSSNQHGVDLKDINFDVHAGEVLGVAGIAGNGQRELMDALSGEVPVDAEDRVIIDDKQVGRSGPMERRIAGLGFVPEERLGHGAVPDMSLWENAFLSGAQSMSLLSKGFIRVKKRC